MKQKVLIVGGESLIGRHLTSCFKACHQPFLVSSKRDGLQSPHSIYLELTEDSNRWRIPQDVTCAVMCAGVTSLAECEKKQTVR